MGYAGLICATVLFLIGYLFFLLAARVYFNTQPFPSWCHRSAKQKVKLAGRGAWAIVTGGNSGLGFETALAIARSGINVIIACRSLDRGQKALDRLQSTLANESNNTNNNDSNVVGEIKLMRLDLADVCSVKAFSQEIYHFFNEEKPTDSLCILCNNAGMVTVNHKYVRVPRNDDSGDSLNVEMQWLVNYLMTVYLTELLMPLIKEHSQRVQFGRIVFVSSLGHSWSLLRLLPGIKSELLSGKHADWSTHDAIKKSLMVYSETKLAVNMYVGSLHKRLVSEVKNDNDKNTSVIKVSSVHPGFIDTNLPHKANEDFISKLFFNMVFYPFIMRPLAYDCELGAQTQINCCLASNEHSSVKSGAYHYDCLPRVQGHYRSAIVQAVQKDLETDEFWKATERFLGLVTP